MHPFTLEDETETVVKVEVVNQPSEKTRRPEFGNGVTLLFAGAATDQPQPALPQEPKRHRGIIKVTSATAGAFVIIGSIGQVSNGQGMRLTVGSANATVEHKVESQSAVYVMSDKTNAVTVSVWDERYQ